MSPRPGRLAGSRLLFSGIAIWRQCLETRPSELRWIQLLGGGVDHIGVDFGRLPYVVTRTTFASGVIAWHAFALLLSLVRGLHDQAAPLLPLPRKAMIIGYGEIGAALGQRLQRNGIEVHGVRRSAGAAPGCDCIHTRDWQDYLPEMDAVFPLPPFK